MIVTFKDSYKINLSFLLSQSLSVMQDFCKLSLEYLTKGPNLKHYQNAAHSVETEEVHTSVETLINILVECCKHQLNDLDFRDSILTFGFNEEQSQVLLDFYKSQLPELKRVLVERTVDYPKFKDLEWRLEAQVASRALLDQMEPQVMMKLSLESGSGQENILLQSDAANFLHMTDALEAALNEAKGQHFRRIQRRLK